MIVTRSWLNEFIDLSQVSNEKLYETFNSIGLEVDSITQIEIAQKVVIGKIISCEKHPDADKLNVCQIDVGSGTRQIVCGAANVVDAEYFLVIFLLNMRNSVVLRVKGWCVPLLSLVCQIRVKGS